MIDKAAAMALSYRDILHHKELKNTDGTPLRIRVNGQCKTWKTRPEEFRVPCKHGMYDYLYVTQIDGDMWEVA
tara:strand:- start:457 stop:675 length:219 start_codon:yes stop_codon:yes gene_type:complete